MAREAYRSLYGDLAKLKDRSLLDDPAGGTDYDDALFLLLLAASDWVDRYCNRHFYPIHQTRYFDGEGRDKLALADDLVSVEQLSVDEQGQGIYTAYEGSLYRLLPLNANPVDPTRPEPYTAVELAPTASKQTFPERRASVRIAGIWGYSKQLEPSGATVDGGVNDFPATIPTTDGTQFAVGQTLAASDELMLVTGIDGNDLTVRRGINGTSPEVHPDGETLYIVRWPAAVERAALITAARIWTRAPAFEPFYVDADVDTDVRLMLEPFRRLPL